MRFLWKGRALAVRNEELRAVDVISLLAIRRNLYKRSALRERSFYIYQFLWFQDLRAPERRSVRRFLYSSGFATMSPERFSAHLVSVGPISS